MLGIVAASENAAMHERVQRLHTASEHFREQFVISLTSLTAKPALSKRVARVPPVEIEFDSQCTQAKARAKSTSPDLSLTLSKARSILRLAKNSKTPREP